MHEKKTKVRYIFYQSKTSHLFSYFSKDTIEKYFVIKEKITIKVGQETQTESVLWRLEQETHIQLHFTFTQLRTSLQDQKRISFSKKVKLYYF